MMSGTQFVQTYIPKKGKKGSGVPSSPEKRKRNSLFRMAAVPARWKVQRLIDEELKAPLHSPRHSPLMTAHSRD